MELNGLPKFSYFKLKFVFCPRSPFKNSNASLETMNNRRQKQRQKPTKLTSGHVSVPAYASDWQKCSNTCGKPRKRKIIFDETSSTCRGCYQCFHLLLPRDYERLIHHLKHTKEQSGLECRINLLLGADTAW